MSVNYTNSTRFAGILTMESLEIPLSSSFYVFFLGIITYCFILVFQSMLLATIVVKRDLHKPMYILLLNLSVCDLMTATSFYPQLFRSILSQSREISYPACVLQAFFLHLCGSGSLLILTAMAYDRYIAICEPLRYHELMSQDTLMKIIFMIWSIDFAIIGLAFILTTREEICRTNIVDIYCNNPSLMKLSCEDIRVTNYYGLFCIALVQGFSILIVPLTYLKILITCVSTKEAKAINKAMQTCGTHLVVFLSYEVEILLLLVSHRFESVSPHLRRACGVAIIIFPPVFNPLIYGLKTREIRQTMFKLFEKKNFFTLSNGKVIYL